MNKGTNLYANSGIDVSEQKLRKGENLTLTYKGLLAASGADKIFVHYGYGDSWECSGITEMKNACDSFTAMIGLEKQGVLNVCFKDSADNWDNNSNNNYSFKVLPKKTARKSKKTIPTE